MKRIPSRIRSMEEWFFYAPPQQRLKHWANGYSAKELARAWFPDSNRLTFPAELRELLATRHETANFRMRAAHAEFESAFDAHSGPIGRGTAHLDLLLIGHCAAARTVIGVEAKTAEHFGRSPVGEYFDAMSKRKRSNVPNRIDQLCTTFFGHSLTTKPTLRNLWYQLPTGLAGTLAEAARRKAQQAVFVVHVSDSLRVRQSPTNAINDAAFRQLLLELAVEVGRTGETGTLFRKDSVHTPSLFVPSLPFFVGKCRRDVTPLLKIVEQPTGESINSTKFYGTNGAPSLKEVFGQRRGGSPAKKS